MIPSTPSYAAFLTELKERIAAARLKASLAVNRELVLLYWSIGRDILTKQKEEGWGAKVIDRLAKDLKHAFPDYTGFSRTNLFYMRAFAEAYPDEPFVHQTGGQIPWKHNCVILDQVKGRAEREWYVRQTIENGWSRSVLVVQIERELYQRLGKAKTNFHKTLPEPQSDLAQQLTKDSYNFDFLGIGTAFKERQLERALLENILALILERARPRASRNGRQS